uniref:(northern house mosquito) hypothetical protein n=1 Tax=Culex pipiens TaxID=7175 RepID=A0A8D8KJQ3_CULPI
MICCQHRPVATVRISSSPTHTPHRTPSTRTTCPNRPSPLTTTLRERGPERLRITAITTTTRVHIPRTHRTCSTSNIRVIYTSTTGWRNRTTCRDRSTTCWPSRTSPPAHPTRPCSPATA